MSAFEDFWTPTRWTRDYGWRPLPGEKNPYTLGYHIGQDIGGRTWYDGVPALRAGRVERVGRSSVIGGYVIIKADADGRFDGYAHMNTTPNNLPGVGERVTRGQDLGKLARSILPSSGHNYTGSGSDGPHLHFTISYKVDNSWNPVTGYDVDPRPYIRSALRGPSPADTGSQPFNPEENDLDARQNAMLEHIYNTLTPGIPNVKHMGEGYAAVIEARDNAKAGFAAIKETRSIAERARVAAQTSADSVTPGIEGVKWDGQLYALVKNGAPAEVNVTELAKQLAPAITAALPRLSADDLAAVSRAVNDEASKRLSKK